MPRPTSGDLGPIEVVGWGPLYLPGERKRRLKQEEARTAKVLEMKQERLAAEGSAPPRAAAQQQSQATGAQTVATSWADAARAAEQITKVPPPYSITKVPPPYSTEKVSVSSPDKGPAVFPRDANVSVREFVGPELYLLMWDAAGPSQSLTADGVREEFSTLARTISVDLKENPELIYRLGELSWGHTLLESHPEVLAVLLKVGLISHEQFATLHGHVVDALGYSDALPGDAVKTDEGTTAETPAAERGSSSD